MERNYTYSDIDTIKTLLETSIKLGLIPKKSAEDILIVLRKFITNSGEIKEKFLKRIEVARFLGIHVNYVDKLARDGYLKKRCFGMRSTRYLESDVIQLVMGNKLKSQV